MPRCAGRRAEDRPCPWASSCPTGACLETRGRLGLRATHMARLDRTPSVVADWNAWSDPGVPVRLGVSSCLLGEPVRYDGGHCRDPFVTQELAPFVEYVPVCPEMEVGLPAPRPIIRLVRGPAGEDRLVVPSSGEDLTERMTAYAERRIGELRALELDGYILKKASPSCGLERIKVYAEARSKGDGIVERKGRGLFTQALLRLWPELPLEEDGRLNDNLLRESFIERAFCRNRWRVLLHRGLSRSRLVEFHTAHKMLLRAHDEAGYQRLGRLLGSAGTLPDAELYATYERELFATLAIPASRGRHVNVLQHLSGYLKDLLGPIEKSELIDAVRAYSRGHQPLSVPLSMIRVQARKHDVEYLKRQVYLAPHPEELRIRARI